MPSIFVWKSAEPNNSKVTVRYFSGSNWFLEDNDGVTRSFLLQDQEVVTDSALSDNVIVFNAKEMKNDWVGTELLEVTQLPYKLIKTDSFGTLDMIGDWFRFISNERVSVNTINEWITRKQIGLTNSLDFNNFLIKLDNASDTNTTNHIATVHSTYKRHNNYHQKFNKNYRHSKPYRGPKLQ